MARAPAEATAPAGSPAAAPYRPRQGEPRVRLLILCPRRRGAVLQRCARLPVACRKRRPSLAARLHAPLSEGVIERALQHLDFGSGDPLRSARLGKRRPLIYDVHQVLDAIRRCTRPGCRAGILQGHFSAVELSRSQRAHARRAPPAPPPHPPAPARDTRPAWRSRPRAPQKVELRRWRTAAARAGSKGASPCARFRHRCRLGRADGTAALRAGAIGSRSPLPAPPAPRPRRARHPVTPGPPGCALSRAPSPGPRPAPPAILLGARQLGRRMTLGTRRPRACDGQFRSAERFIRQRGLSAPGKEASANALRRDKPQHATGFLLHSAAARRRPCPGDAPTTLR